MSSSVILWKMTTVPGSRNVTETLVRCNLQRDFSSSTMYTSHYFSVVCNNIEWLTCQPTCPHPQLPDNVFNTQKIRIVLKHELDHASPSLNLSMASHCIARPFVTSSSTPNFICHHCSTGSLSTLATLTSNQFLNTTKLPTASGSFYLLFFSLKCSSSDVSLVDPFPSFRS